MISTPLAYEEVAQKVSFAQATHLDHTEFGKAKERFNTIHVIFPMSEFFFMMINPMMAVTIDARPSQNLQPSVQTVLLVKT
jgi:hypothetical protein